MAELADVDLAHSLADHAASIAMSFFGASFTTRTKPDGSLVTEADEAVEDALRARLAAERPDDAVLGEERGRTGISERIWILDAIDGTHRFAVGAPEWGCLIALRIAGTTALGIVEQPAVPRRYWAVSGEGAWRRTGGIDEPIRTSTVSGLDHARAVMPSPEWCRTDRARLVAEEFARLTAMTPADHPAMQVAWGGIEAGVLFECGPWDLAAPAIVVEEAGGRFSDLDGHYSIDSGSGLFTNGLVHDALVERVSPRTP